MKTKHVEPTQEQIVDFYYRLLAYMDKDGYLLKGHDNTFYKYPTHYTNLVDSDLTDYPRETSPEVYEYYVSDGDINLIVRDHGMVTKSIYLNRRGKHKIKITICEDE